MSTLLAFLLSPDVLVIIVPLVLGLLGWVAKHAVKLIKYQRVQELLLALGRHARTAILATEAEYTAAIREASADGTLTPEEKAAARAKAIAKLKSYCGFDDLSKIWNDAARADQVMIDSIESEFQALKAVGLVPSSARPTSGPDSTK